jgi:hypothetical protein
MTDSTIKNTLFYTFLIFASVSMMCLIFMKQCNPHPKPHRSSYDSIVDVLKGYDKFIGIREIEYKAQVDRAIKAENALNDRKPIYIERVKVIREQAPDTCQPYLTAMQAECDTLQMRSDSTIAELKQTVAKADTLIKGVVSKSETLEHFNDKLTSENKELEKDKAKAERKVKRAKIVSKVVTWSAAVLVGVITFVTVVK